MEPKVIKAGKVAESIPAASKTVLVLSTSTFGIGDNYPEAKQNVKDAGADLRDGYRVYVFDDTTDPESITVDMFGGVSWQHADPESDHPSEPIAAFLVPGRVVKAPDAKTAAPEITGTPARAQSQVRCSACGSTEPHHIDYVRRTGYCVV
jgi:hypothetical protein